MAETQKPHTHIAIHAIQHGVDGKIEEIAPRTPFTPSKDEVGRLMKIGAIREIKKEEPAEPTDTSTKSNTNTAAPTA